MYVSINLKKKIFLFNYFLFNEKYIVIDFCCGLAVDFVIESRIYFFYKKGQKIIELWGYREGIRSIIGTMTASFTQPSRAEPSRVDPVRAAVDFF
jgi:hypothetical protein